MKTDDLDDKIWAMLANMPVSEPQHLPIRLRSERIRVFPPPWKSEPIDDDTLRLLLVAFASDPTS